MMKGILILISLLLASFINAKGQNNASENNKEIIEYTTKKLNESPSDIKYYLARAEARYFFGDLKGALQDCNDFIKQDKTNGYAYFNRGIIKKGLKDFTGSINDFTKAINYSKENLAEIYFARGSAYHDIKNYPNAIHDYKKAIEYDKNYVTTYNNLGLLYNETFQYEKAIEVLNQAISLDSTRANAFYNRAYSEIKLKKYQQAEEDLKHALSIDPENGFANNYMGLNLYNQGKVAEACKYFQLAKKKGIKPEVSNIENCE